MFAKLFAAEILPYGVTKSPGSRNYTDTA